MNTEELLDNLRIDLEWAEANEWESPIMLSDDLRECILLIEENVPLPEEERRQEELEKAFRTAGEAMRSLENNGQ